MNFPDPDEILQIVTRIRDAFNRAAEAETGSAKPLFKSLNARANSLFDMALDPDNQGQDPQKMIMRMLPQFMQLQMTLSQLKREAERNPAVGATMQHLMRDVQDEVKFLLPLIGQIPGFPKIPGLPDFGQPKQDDTPRVEDKTPPAPPKPPKKGGFKF